MSTQTTTEIVARAKTEVLEDVRDGIVPRDISRAFELHDYVDANEYGGMCAENFPEDMETDTTAEEMFLALDTWIQSGALKEA